MLELRELYPNMSYQLNLFAIMKRKIAKLALEKLRLHMYKLHEKVTYTSNVFYTIQHILEFIYSVNNIIY